MYASAPEDPPRLLRIIGLLRGANARRGLYALVVLLQTLGEQLHPDRHPTRLHATAPRTLP
jgi:hypothetical protein